MRLSYGTDGLELNPQATRINRSSMSSARGWLRARRVIKTLFNYLKSAPTLGRSDGRVFILIILLAIGMNLLRHRNGETSNNEPIARNSKTNSTSGTSEPPIDVSSTPTSPNLLRLRVNRARLPLHPLFAHLRSWLYATKYRRHKI